MADDSQNCLRDSQTMSEISDKNTLDGIESSPTKPKMTDIISDQPSGEETLASDHKIPPNDQFDSCVTQSQSDDIRTKADQQQDSQSVTDENNKTTEECPQTTETGAQQPPSASLEAHETDQRVTEKTTGVDCASSKTLPVDSNCKVDDTSPAKSCEAEPQQQIVDLIQEAEHSCPVNNSTHTTSDVTLEEKSPAGELLPALENSEPAKNEEPTKEEASHDSAKLSKEQSPSEAVAETAISTTTADTSLLPMVTTTVTTTSNNPPDVTAELSGLRVALPEIETNKSDTACAPDPAQKASSSGTSQSGAAGTAKDSPSTTAHDKVPPESVYHVKWVQVKGKSTAIVTQNENGPCPLLAIMNCLLLQGRVKLPPMMEMVTSSQLMEYLGDCILGNAPKNITEDAQLNYEQNMQDAMDVFHKLQTGLDVNVRFTGVSDFEYTRECIVFDLLNIPLYHGWLVDPESPEVVAAVGNCSYNQLVEKIISQKNSSREELMTEALIAEEYLERSAAQLTYHGLSELVTTVKEDELCIFFRNNHFSTLYKHKKELFLLVTDQGFLTEANVVWETLSNVEGDGHFVDTDFRTFRKPEVSTAPIAVPEIPLGTDQQIDQDYLVALSLQQEQQGDHSQPVAPGTAQAWPQPSEQGIQPTLSDHEFALQLQEEEDRRAATAAGTRQAHSGDHRRGSGPAAQRASLQHQSSTASSTGGSRKDKKSDCIIL